MTARARTIARALITPTYLQMLRQRVAAKQALFDAAEHGDAEALIALGRLVLDQGNKDDNEDDTGTAATRRGKGTTNE